MSYWQLNAVFLAVVVIIGCLALVTARRRVAPSITILTVGLGALILLLVSAVFDNVMIGVGLVGYDRARISGAFIGIAPLEDFAYPIAAAVLLPSLWMLLGRREAAAVGASAPRSPVAPPSRSHHESQE